MKCFTIFRFDSGYLRDSIQIGCGYSVTLTVMLFQEFSCRVVSFFRVHGKTASHQLLDVTKRVFDQIIQASIVAGSLCFDEVFKRSNKMAVLNGISAIRWEEPTAGVDPIIAVIDNLWFVATGTFRNFAAAVDVAYPTYRAGIFPLLLNHLGCQLWVYLVAVLL